MKNSKMARRYGEEFKRQAVELMIHSGKTQREILRKVMSILGEEPNPGMR